MKSSTDKEALLLLTHLIEFVYRLLWGDLFTLPVGGGIGISLMVDGVMNISTILAAVRVIRAARPGDDGEDYELVDD